MSGPTSGNGAAVRTIRHLTLAATLPLLLTACGSSGSDAAADWSGTMDTLASGEIVVRNTDDPLWTPEEAWRAVEDLRIGSATSDGPDLFGAILSFDVDAWGRIFVLDDQAQEVRIFDSGGAFVRTVGRRGEGPGEFIQAGSVDLSRNGEIWVMGMSLGRVSIFDTTGTYLRGERTNAGGMIMKPYRGGFDPMGRYNVVVRSGGMRRMMKDHESIPVTAEEREEAVKNLEWFTSQGGTIDRTKFPKSKPATASFFIDDERNLWVERQVAAADGDDEGRLFDLFDAEGRYLGTLRLPFELGWSIPEPIVREGVLYGVTSDGLGVPYLVCASSNHKALVRSSNPWRIAPFDREARSQARTRSHTAFPRRMSPTRWRPAGSTGTMSRT